MPTFDVTVRGRGIIVPIGDSAAVGFFRTVRVSGRDVANAERAALDISLAEWKGGPNASLNRGDNPRITVDSVTAVSWWQRLSKPNRGYVFYRDEEEP